MSNNGKGKQKICTLCNGAGKYSKKDCPICDGYGFIKDDYDNTKPAIIFTITTVGELYDAILKHEAVSKEDLQKLPEQMLKDGTAKVLKIQNVDDVNDNACFNDLLTSLKQKGFNVNKLNRTNKKEMINNQAAYINYVELKLYKYKLCLRNDIDSPNVYFDLNDLPFIISLYSKFLANVVRKYNNNLKEVI